MDMAKEQRMYILTILWPLLGLRVTGGRTYGKAIQIARNIRMMVILYQLVYGWLGCHPPEYEQDGYHGHNHGFEGVHHHFLLEFHEL